jgi:hypothetical protein
VRRSNHAILDLEAVNGERLENVGEGHCGRGRWWAGSVLGKPGVWVRFP